MCVHCQKAGPSPKRVKPSLEAPTNFKKHHCQTRPRIKKRERPWSLSLKEFGVKKRKKKKILNQYLSFSSCPSLSSSASYFCSAPWLHSDFPSPLFQPLLLSLFLFFSSISTLDPHELTTLKATFVVHFLHLVSLSPEIFCLLTYQAPPTWPILVHTLQIYIYVLE